jgi:ubiquinone/menaquinone biosynthesis C-methylase UbiE
MRTESATREYDNLAAVYDHRWRHYVDVSVRQSASALHLRGDERLLDVGCGTGTFLQKLQRDHPGLKLHGIDPSDQMLKVARRKCGHSVAFEKGDAGRLPYPESQFDAVTSISALHFFPDGGRAVAEMARVLQPGGRIVITDWCADFLPMRLFAVWQRWRKAPLGHIHRVAELRQLMEATGLAIDHTKYFRIRPLWGMMLVSAREKSSPPTR